MVNLSISALVYGALILIFMVSMISFFGVLLGGLLVFKTKFVGTHMFESRAKTPEPVTGLASQAVDEYLTNEDSNTVLQGNEEPLNPDDEEFSPKVDSALSRILNRNDEFSKQLRNSGL